MPPVQSRAPEGGKCAECGYPMSHVGEYHPYVFCVLVKAGQNPWERAKELAIDLGPFTKRRRPPLVREVQEARRA